MSLMPGWIEAKTKSATKSALPNIFTNTRPCARWEDIKADILALEAETDGLLGRYLDYESLYIL